MRLPGTGLTLPWQLVAAQDPGPMYLMGSGVSVAERAAQVKESKQAATKRAGREGWELW